MTKPPKLTWFWQSTRVSWKWAMNFCTKFHCPSKNQRQPPVELRGFSLAQACLVAGGGWRVGKCWNGCGPWTVQGEGGSWYKDVWIESKCIQFWICCILWTGATLGGDFNKMIPIDEHLLHLWLLKLTPPVLFFVGVSLADAIPLLCHGPKWVLFPVLNDLLQA